MEDKHHLEQGDLLKTHSAFNWLTTFGKGNSW